MEPADAALLGQLQEILGAAHVLLPADRPSPRQGDPAQWSGALATIRPGSTQELAQALKCIAKAGRTIVPQGGATGLVEGCASKPRDILLSTERLNAIEDVDQAQRVMTVGAGVPLQVAQEAAAQAGLFFPLDLGARGSATVGGAISTNAGGNRVIRYGMMRDLVLGLEVVLADGRIISSMNTLLKNNTGYDLKQLFIGSEGTLGIVTRAVLRLWPASEDRQMALAGLSTIADAGALLTKVQRATGGTLTAFEAMWARFYELASTAICGQLRPLSLDYPFYILIECQGGLDTREALEACLAEAYEESLLQDVVIAQSEADCQTFWSIRDGVEEVQKLGPLLMYDVGLPIAHMQRYTDELQENLAGVPGVVEAVTWGHLGDSNLHIWIVCEHKTEATARRVNDLVYTPLRDVGGTISAEHGIGLEKQPYLGLSRTDEEIQLMAALKTLFDPNGVLNPEKVLRP